MKRIGTLGIYFDLKRAGIDEEQAKAQATAFETSFSALYEDFKDMFASNRLMTIFGSIIIGIGSFTLIQMWNLSHDLTEVRCRITNIETTVNK